MKNKLIIFGIGLLVLSGCGTSANFMADDVYMVRPSKLPIGESSADETSYAAFLNRKEGENRDQQIYSDERNLNESRRCLNEPYWYDGCGCSLEFWSFYSPYSGRNRTTAFNPYYGMGYHNMMFSSNFPYAYPYYGSGFGFYNSMMLMNPGYGGYYGMGWGTSYGYNPYGFGSGYGYYGYNNWGYGYGGNHNSTFSSGVTHSGPRGSTSGYANPNGRASSGQPLKVGKAPVNYGHHGSTAVRPTRSVKPVESTSTYRTPSSKPTSVTRTEGQRSNGTTTTPNRTYQSSSNTPTRTYNSGGSTGTSGRSGTYNSSSSGSSTRESSGSSYESRGSSSGSSSSPSRSSGSSSGSSNPSPGRRN